MATVAFRIDIRIPQLHQQPGGQTFLGYLAPSGRAAGAIIPFEVGGQQFSEFPHDSNLAPTWKPRSLLLPPSLSKAAKLPSLGVAPPTAEQEEISRNKARGQRFSELPPVSRHFPAAYRRRPAWEVNRRLSIKDLCVQGVDTRQPNSLIPRGRSSNPSLME
jgi:hypothetical protein